LFHITYIFFQNVKIALFFFCFYVFFSEIGVNPREWLNDVIAKLPYYCPPGRTKNLKELLPAYWQKNDAQ
jgi:hypothetical protein